MYVSYIKRSMDSPNLLDDGMQNSTSFSFVSWYSIEFHRTIQSILCGVLMVKWWSSLYMRKTYYSMDQTMMLFVGWKSNWRKYFKWRILARKSVPWGRDSSRWIQAVSLVATKTVYWRVIETHWEWVIPVQYQLQWSRRYNSKTNLRWISMM